MPTWLWKVSAFMLDVLVAPSFGAPGYRVSRHLWDSADDQVDLTGRVFLVTGANAGLGFATTRALAARGATVRMVCRNKERGERARGELGAEGHPGTLELDVVDVSDLDAVRRFARDFAAGGSALHGLIHNAGALVAERQTTAHGLEVTFATHVVGPFLLTELLAPALIRSAPARVVFVSSGGMYGQRLDLNVLRDGPEPFDGVRAYAQAKRAQVLLAHEWNERLAPQGVTVASMHPGWVDTGGVRTALPRFYSLTRRFLRTPAQGADTIVWLAAAPGAKDPGGGFFFDRRRRRQHAPFACTKTTPKEVAELWELCRLTASMSGE